MSRRGISAIGGAVDRWVAPVGVDKAAAWVPSGPVWVTTVQPGASLA